MRKTFQIAAAAALFPIMALASQAKAAVLVLPGPLFSANLTWNNDGTVSLNTAPTVDYTGVQQQNELFDNFSSGSTLPAGSNINLSFAPSGVLDYHTISFNNFFGATGGTFTWSFDISVIGARDQISTKASLLQTVGTGTSNLNMVDNNSNAYNLHFVQSGANVQAGTTSLNFLPDTTSLHVIDTVIVSTAFGSDTVGVANSFVEGPATAIPEMRTWAMMALGFAGLGFVGYRTSRTKGDAAFA